MLPNIAPQSRIIQEYRDKIEETKKEQQLHSRHSSSNGNDSVNNTNITNSIIGNSKGTVLGNSSINTKTVEDDIIIDEDNNHNDNDNNNPLKQITNITNSNTSSNIGSNNSSKSSPQVLQQAELSDSLEASYHEMPFRDLYDSNIYDIRLDDIPLLDDVLFHTKFRIERILTCLGDYKIEKTNSEKEAEKFVDMIFDEIESVKTEKEIKQLNKIYVPQFNIEHNDGMNLYDLYRMYHADVPLLRAKCIIMPYPEEDSFEKKLLYRILPEAMKVGVIDSLERIFRSSIFEPFAKVRINKIRETMKQKKELNRLDRILNDQELCGEQLLEV